MIKELDIIKLKKDIGILKKGDKGTVIEVYKGGKAYEVEFFKAVITLTDEEIE